jgi:uncharacterized protein (TIGR01777 family)
MDVLVTGSSGLIGTALVEALHARGDTVRRAVRRTATGGDVQWDPVAGKLDAAALDGVDAVVNLAGAGIGDHRWTDAYKAEVVDSRVKGTALLARTIAERTGARPAVLVSGSAIGYYGNRGDEQLDETSAPGTDFLADLCVQWEAATAPAQQAGVRVAHIRTGIVLSPKGGALKKQLPLFKLGLGGSFGSGKQWQSWISIDDEIAAILHVLDHDVRGAVNLVAPNPVTNREFTRTLGHALHRPAVFPIPKFGPALLLGSELTSSLLFFSQRVRPATLEASGFSFGNPTLESALADLLLAAA